MSNDELSTARQRRERRRHTAPAGAFGPSTRKQVPIDRAMEKVRDAERLKGPPTPERITAALDICGLYGPEVDEALGGQEPMVDEWESGDCVPTKEQIHAIARLTGFPVKFFYLPPPDRTSPVIICGEDGCRSLGPHDQ
jgi:hypothetical protein